MNDQNNFSAGAVHIGNNFVNESSDDSFLQPHIGVRVIPHHLELTRQISKFFWLRCGMVASFLEMLGDLGFDRPHALQSLIPTLFQFTGYQAVLWIRSIVLPLCSLSSVTCRFQVPSQGFE